MPERDEDILEEAQERFERAQEHQSYAHENFRSDMRFANGTDENQYQWDDGIRAARVGRPCLTINKARIHCLQITNDARQNPAQVRVSPVADRASYESAQIFEGVIRHIEYISNAQLAYATATYNQVVGGIGYWRVLTDYVDDDSLDQDIFIRRIPDPTNIFLDPDIQQYDGSDARWAFVFYDMERSEFDAKYPRADREDDDDVIGSGPLNNRGPWRSDDKHVRLVEYYRKGEEADTLIELVDGTTLRESELPDGALKQIRAQNLITRQRKIAIPTVEWFLIADNDKIIDRRPWPGKYIPIVRVPCEEIIIDGKLDWVSHTRHLRDAQRLYNWYSSSAAEFVALQSKAPYVGTAEGIGPYKAQWERANIDNQSVLLYQGIDPETGQPLPPPQRAQPPVMAAAYMEGLKIAQQEMMLATGQYQAVMGEPSNETSGVAINARQRQGDNATYHVIDHLASAIRFTGRILIDLIPRVYDTRRVLMIIGEDGSEQAVHVDPEAAEAHQQAPDPTRPGQAADDPEAAVRTIWNPNIGRYAVVSDVGPSYATKRQQSFDAFSQIMAKNPSAWPVIGDFWAKAADFPGAEELAERMKRGLPPQYQDGPDPQVAQLQNQLQTIAQHGQQIAQQADAHVASLQAEIVRLQEQLRDRSSDVATKDYSAETDRLKAIAAADPAAAQVVIRHMLSQLLGMPALPVMHAHQTADDVRQAAVQQAVQPPAEDDGLAPNGADSSGPTLQ